MRNEAYNWREGDDSRLKITDDGGLVDGSLIYLRTKNVLFYIGGYDENNDCDIDEIYQFSIITQQWKFYDHVYGEFNYDANRNILWYFYEARHRIIGQWVC